MDHTDVTRALDRLRREVRILLDMGDQAPKPEDQDAVLIHNHLILQQTKKVRTTSTLLVRALARERDELQPKEGTSA